MIRAIDRFHQDSDEVWVADLSCLHRQHVRHQPPFQLRPWVQTAAGREGRLGGAIECPQCDCAELPEGLRRVRTAGPFDAETLPAGLRRVHRVAARTWGKLRVLDGTVGFSMQVEPPIAVRLGPGSIHAIPPEVDHAVAVDVEVDGPFLLAVDFLVR